MVNSWFPTSWQDVALLVGIVATMAGVGGAMLRSRLDSKAAEAAASDRIIRLVEVEADKRVQVVRTEFELKIAQMELTHRDQLTAMRVDFEGQLAGLKAEHDRYRCELAPVCHWRNRKNPPPAPTRPA